MINNDGLGKNQVSPKYTEYTNYQFPITNYRNQKRKLDIDIINQEILAYNEVEKATGFMNDEYRKRRESILSIQKDIIMDTANTAEEKKAVELEEVE